MSRTLPNDNVLLNRYMSLWVPKNGKYKTEPDGTAKYSQAMLDTFKASKEYDSIIECMRKRWLKDEIAEDIEQAVLNKAMLEAKGDWDEREAAIKRLKKLYDEMAALGDDNDN